MNKVLIIACFIILLMSETCSAQYYLDSTQAVKTLRIKYERDSLLITSEFLNVENDSLKSRTALLDRKLELKQNIIDMQETVITYKDKQILKLEQTPVIKEFITTKWYVWAGVIISSVCAGIITGLIIHK